MPQHLDRALETYLDPTRKDPSVAAVCEICGKQPWFGKQVSHSHRRSTKRWSPNIQRLKVWEDGRAVRRDVCTSCIKAGKVQRPPVRK